MVSNMPYPEAWEGPNTSLAHRRELFDRVIETMFDKAEAERRSRMQLSEEPTTLFDQAEPIAAIEGDQNA